MKKIISILSMLVVIMLFIGTVEVRATTVDDLPGLMQNSSTINPGDTDTNIGKTINKIIGLIQVSGTGIALIGVTILGIRYLIASPAEKADTKKAIEPVLIGCFLLFGAVNLVAIVANFSQAIK